MFEQREDVIEANPQLPLDLAQALPEHGVLPQLAQRVDAAPTVEAHERERVGRYAGDQLGGIRRAQQVPAVDALGVALELDAVTLGDRGGDEPVELVQAERSRSTGRRRLGGAAVERAHKLGK